MFNPTGVLFFLHRLSGCSGDGHGLLDGLDSLPVLCRLRVIDSREVRQRELVWLPPFPIARTPFFGNPYEAKSLDFAHARANCVPAHAELVEVAVCHRQLAILLATVMGVLDPNTRPDAVTG
jgi:hypothetical protein